MDIMLIRRLILMRNWKFKTMLHYSVKMVVDAEADVCF